MKQFRSHLVENTAAICKRLLFNVNHAWIAGTKQNEHSFARTYITVCRPSAILCKRFECIEAHVRIDGDNVSFEVAAKMCLRVCRCGVCNVTTLYVADTDKS